MKKNGVDPYEVYKCLDIHLISGYSYHYWSFCVVKMSKFILIPHLCGYISALDKLLGQLGTYATW